jgi:hypothetical protein
MELNKKFIGVGEVSGFAFEQVYADNKWRVYQVSSYGTSWYEVFQRRKLNGQEIYPKSKQFGDTAWSVPSLEKALEKIKEKSNMKRQSVTTVETSAAGKKRLVQPKRATKATKQATIINSCRSTVVKEIKRERNQSIGNPPSSELKPGTQLFLPFNEQ